MAGRSQVTTKQAGASTTRSDFVRADGQTNDLHLRPSSVERVARGKRRDESSLCLHFIQVAVDAAVLLQLSPSKVHVMSMLYSSQGMSK